MAVAADGGRIGAWLNLVRAEYQEMPGLCLTKPQMQRLWGFDAYIADALIEALLLTRVLRKTTEGTFVAFHSAH